MKSRSAVIKVCILFFLQTHFLHPGDACHISWHQYPCKYSITSHVDLSTGGPFQGPLEPCLLPCGLRVNFQHCLAFTRIYSPNNSLPLYRYLADTFAGAQLSDILQNIDEFYRTQQQDRESPTQVIDHRFKTKVWAWLVRNPEVSVGENNQWNHLTLDEAEKISSKATNDGKDSSNHDADSKSAPSSLRIFVSKERTWRAVAGHAPDDSKVVPLEFALLSIIASCKSKGIAQPDLVKLSGQDKRSVPKRTDALHRKGYIDKRPIQTKTARTSLCTLQRFRHSTAQTTADQPKDGGQPAGDEAQSANMIDFDSFNNKLFDILREHQIIAREDLKRKLGFKDKWRWKVLSRAVRKWERIGVVKRIRAESQYEKLHPCIKLERDPTATDLQLFHEFDFEVLSKHGVEKAGSAIPIDRQQEEGGFEAPLKGSSGPDEGNFDMSKGQTGPTKRIVPSWTPDRNLNNQLFDVINATGTTGITNMVRLLQYHP